jgi:hypothetical protein
MSTATSASVVKSKVPKLLKSRTSGSLEGGRRVLAKRRACTVWLLFQDCLAFEQDFSSISDLVQSKREEKTELDTLSVELPFLSLLSYRQLLGHNRQALQQVMQVSELRRVRYVMSIDCPNCPPSTLVPIGE